MKELKRHDGHRGISRAVSHRGFVPFIPFQGLVSEMFHRPGGFDFEQTVREPGLDIAEIGDKVVVKAELPGMEEKDIAVRLEGDTLTISAEKSAKREIRKRDYTYRETRFGAIQRSFRLPRGVARASQKSSYKDGVLTIEFLKK